MIPLNTQLGLPPRAFWYVGLRSLVVALLVVVLGSLFQLLAALPGATCGGHACDPASGAHIAAFIYLFAAFLVVRAALNFKWFSFVVTDRSVTITSGVLSRNTTTIRFDRIQDVNTRVDLLHRLLGLKSLAIWTASPDQRIGSTRRPDGLIVLEGEDADWLRDYLSDPPAAAASPAGSRRDQPVSVAPHQGNGAVMVALLIAAGLVVLAAMAAGKRSAPAVPTTAASSGTAAPAPAYVAKRGADGRIHLHVTRSAPGQPSAASAPVAAAPPAASDYGVACAIHAQQATLAVRACADLATGERCTHETDFPSRPTAEPALLTLVNRSDQGVKFYWLDPSGTRKLYGSVAPGADVGQASHAGAHWLVSTADGKCLGVFDAATTKIGLF